MNAKTLDLVWLALVAATLTTWTLGETGSAGPLVVAVLLALAGLKGWLVIGEFMALKRVALRWRAPVLGWLLLVLGAIALAYWNGMRP